jgi:hypothetical protein
LGYDNSINVKNIGFWRFEKNQNGGDLVDGALVNFFGFLTINPHLAEFQIRHGFGKIF